MAYLTAFGGAQLILIGVLALVVTIACWRLWANSRRARKGEAGKAVPATPTPRADVTTGSRELEAKLRGLARDIEARIEHRISELDRLLAEADKEIARLRTLVKSSNAIAQPPAVGDSATSTPSASVKSANSVPMLRAVREPADPPSAPVDSGELAPEQRRLIVHLDGMGYDIEQIARLLGREKDAVRSVLIDAARPKAA